MKNYIDPTTKEVFSYEADGSQDDFIKTGLLPISDAELAALRAPTLAALMAGKNSEINAARLAANRSTFAHAGKSFACDELSRGDIDGANGYVTLYGAMPPGWPGGWKAVDNSYHQIADVAAWKAFYTSMFAAGSGNFSHAQTLKTQLAVATTEAQVAAIVW